MLYMVTIGLEADSVEAAHEQVRKWGVDDASLPDKVDGLQAITATPEEWHPAPPSAGPPPDFSGEPKPPPPPDNPGTTGPPPAPSTTEPELPVEIRSEMLDETQTESDDLATP